MLVIYASLQHAELPLYASLLSEVACHCMWKYPKECQGTQVTWTVLGSLYIYIYLYLYIYISPGCTKSIDIFYIQLSPLIRTSIFLRCIYIYIYIFNIYIYVYIYIFRIFIIHTRDIYIYIFRLPWPPCQELYIYIYLIYIYIYITYIYILVLHHNIYIYYSLQHMIIDKLPYSSINNVCGTSPKWKKPGISCKPLVVFGAWPEGSVATARSLDTWPTRKPSRSTEDDFQGSSYDRATRFAFIMKAISSMSTRYVALMKLHDQALLHLTTKIFKLYIYIDKSIYILNIYILYIYSIYII